MLWFARCGGTVAWWILLRERRKILEHLHFAFGPALDLKSRSKIGMGVFQNLVQAAVDALRMPKLSREELNQLVACEPGFFEKVNEALEHGRGLICLTGHVGNWELVTSFVIWNGYNASVVGRRIYYEPFNRVLERIRAAAGAQVIYRDEPARSILEMLRKNQIIGILPDQDVDSIEGIFVPFFGAPAHTPTAPAKLSYASGAPILPLFLVREGKGYRMIWGELMWPERISDKSEKDEAVRMMTIRWTKAVETVIRKYPDQWVWMHRRWKTTPEREAVRN